ncbi:hypothetical protein FNYG_14655 [Fusarium nygamai]|uniref:Uncharacterized protein n=1 Tax=Gibberella nygamai TaxID=42673 RepID=A0A2K0US78_GIBNY|nr:hypothetical protein FNYG_14655 [Fusarium nygamai]
MKFFSAGVFSILGATSAVSAWQVGLYTAESKCDDTSDKPIRWLTSQLPPNTDCLNLDQIYTPAARTTCVEVEPGLESPCDREFVARSILVVPGARCEIYSALSCGDGSKIISDPKGNPRAREDAECSVFKSFAPIKSIKCSSVNEWA